MPGLTFIHHPGSETGPSPAEDARAGLDACCYDERYRLRRLLDRPDRLLVSAAYHAYPVAAFETPRYHLALEGRLYDVEAPDAREDELRRLARLLFEERRAPVREWLLRTDGPFLFFAEEKASRRWAFLNDALGRLPAYYHATGRAFFLSRSLPFFVKMEDGPPPDALGMAQQLLRGFPLGRRTLLEGVRRMQPGTLLRGTADSAETEATAVYTFNFEERRHRRRSLGDNAQRLAGLLGEACTRRAGLGERDVLALSGGLDSRAVAFALQQEGLPFERLTFRRHDDSNARDVKAAAAVARQCKAPGTVLALAPPTGRSCLRLLQAAGGRNLFDVAYVIDFLEQTRRQFGSAINVLTGDGGGYILGDHRPARSLSGAGALAQYIAGECWVPPAVVSRLTGVPEKRLVESIRARLAAYPETDPAQQYIHFFLYERLFNYSYIGEDRNRCYFWESAPLYGLDFFRYAMNCPDEQRADYALFREVLLNLSPRALDVGYANFLGTKMTAWGYRSYAFLRALVRRVPPLKRFLDRRLGRSAPPGDALLSALRRQAEAPAGAGALDARALHRLLQRPDALSRLAWANLFTATSFLEWQRGDGSTVLDEQADTPLL